MKISKIILQSNKEFWTWGHCPNLLYQLVALHFRNEDRWNFVRAQFCSVNATSIKLPIVMREMMSLLMVNALFIYIPITNVHQLKVWKVRLVLAISLETEYWNMTLKKRDVKITRYICSVLFCFWIVSNVSS